MNEKRIIRKAEKLGINAGNNEKVILKIQRKISAMNRGPIKKVWNMVTLLWEKAKSPEVPATLKLQIIGALLYLILPFDIVPDAVPAAGLLDDVIAITYIFKKVNEWTVQATHIVKAVEQSVYENCFKKIDLKLRSLEISWLTNSLIALLLNVLALLFLRFQPFGSPYSMIVSICLVALVFIKTVIGFALNCKKYGNNVIDVSKCVFKKKSVKKGIEFYVEENYPKIAFVYAGMKIVNKILPAGTIADFNEITRTFIRHYRFTLVFYGISVFIYVLLIFLLRSIIYGMIG